MASAFALMLSATASGNDVAFAYTQDVFHNADGGLRTGTAWMNNVDLTYRRAFDDGARGTLFAYVLHNNGNSFSNEYAGDTQVVSNIDAPRATRVYELWYDYPVNDHVSLLFGKFDLNSEFDVIDSAGLFLHSSHGIGAAFGLSGRNGPSIFPVTSLAARIHWRIDDARSLRYAMFDAVAGDPADPSATTINLGQGVLHALEYNQQLSGRLRLGLGAWRYSSSFARVDGTGNGDDNDGAYVFADARLWQDRGGPSLDGFVRFGVADERFNRVERYTGAGIVLSSFSRRRPEDRIGLAVAHARTSSRFRAASPTPRDRAETAIELTWHAPITPWLQIQPDIQYIIDPSFEPMRDDALVFGLRFVVSVDRRL